jgi:uncharacterized protein (DUF362 family)
MGKKTTVAVAHSDADLGKPAEYTREQLDLVKAMIRQVADQTMGGMPNIVHQGDKVLIKINTVIPVPANAGFTTDPRMLEALIELVQEQNPGRIQIGERCAMGADTMEAMRVCGIVDVAERTGVELCPFEHVEFDMYKIDRPISFNEFPVPRPVRDADCYIGLPKMKVHVHTTFTGAMKLQFGNLPNYDWMVRCHRDDIYQKIVNLTRAANAKWFVMDSLYACQGNGPFSPYSEDLIKDFNTIWWRPRPGSRGHRVRSADGLGLSRHQCASSTGAAEGWERTDGRDRTGRGADRKSEAALQTAEHDPAGQGIRMSTGHGVDLRSRLQGDRADSVDQLHADGTLARLEKPLTIFTGLQSEQHINKVEGDVLIVGDCAKGHARKVPERPLLGRMRRVSELHPDLGEPARRRNRELCQAVDRRSRRARGIRLMGSPSAVLKGMRIARPEPIPRSDYRLRQGVLKLLAVKDSDIRILTLEQCRDAVDKGLHAGGAFSAVIPLTALYYGGSMDIDIADPTRRGQDPFTLSKGHAVAAAADLRRPRLFQPRHPS